MLPWCFVDVWQKMLTFCWGPTLNRSTHKSLNQTKPSQINQVCSTGWHDGLTLRFVDLELVCPTQLMANGQTNQIQPNLVSNHRGHPLIKSNQISPFPPSVSTGKAKEKSSTSESSPSTVKVKTEPGTSSSSSTATSKATKGRRCPIYWLDGIDSESEFEVFFWKSFWILNGLRRNILRCWVANSTISQASPSCLVKCGARVAFYAIKDIEVREGGSEEKGDLVHSFRRGRKKKSNGTADCTGCWETPSVARCFQINAGQVQGPE